MARYQVPPDPRKDESSDTRSDRVGQGPPWLWIGLGAIVTVLAIAVAILWVRLFTSVEPLDIEPTPSVTFQTAVPEETEQVATATPDQVPTATPESTGVPESTPDTSEPGAIQIGITAIVTGTEGVGVSLRSGPGTDNARLGVAYDGDVVEVVDGPEESGGFTWWFVRAADGTEAWLVEAFLQKQ